MKIRLSGNAYEFACRSAACRPPTSGRTGGSTPSGKSDRSYQNDPAFKARIREITGRHTGRIMSTPVHFKGPGQWRSQAAEKERLDNDDTAGVELGSEHEPASPGVRPRSSKA